MSLSLTRAQQQIDTILVESKGDDLRSKRKNAALGRNSFARGILWYGIQLIELQGTSRRQTL